YGGVTATCPVHDAVRDLVGLLTRDDVVRALAASGAETPIGAAMHRQFAVADAGEPLEHALARLRASACDAIPVLQRGALVGVLRVENVGELIAVRAALRTGRSTWRPRAV